jgi:protease-4
MYSEHRDFTEEERARFEDNHWDGFNLWLQDVSKFRKIPLEKLETLAMGRVWTGRQAKENGLIDEIGGLETALSLAKELVNIPADQQVTIVDYPKKKGLLETLTSGGAGTAAIRWMLYRFVREDLTQSLELLAAKEYVID